MNRFPLKERREITKHPQAQPSFATLSASNLGAARRGARRAERAERLERLERAERGEGRALGRFFWSLWGGGGRWAQISGFRGLIHKGHRRSIRPLAQSCYLPAMV